MQIPLQITFHELTSSPDVEAAIRERVDHLEKIHHHITGCRVVVETPHRHHRKGKLYHVRVDVTVPGSELVARRGSQDNHAHEDVFVAIRDAFNATERQLRARVERQRHDVKTHEPMAAAHVVRLFADEGYGFLETPDGREIYFHKNSVLDDGFAALEVGTTVRFVEEQGDKGPQASTVTPL